MTTHHDKQISGFMMEHPAAWTTVQRLAEKYEEQIDLHLCTNDATAPLVPGDVVVRHLRDHRPLAVVHTNGTIVDLTKD